jgi:hypothetical protein
MTAQAVAGEDQMRAVLKSIAMSEPFLYKNTHAPTAAGENRTGSRRSD